MSFLCVLNLYFTYSVPFLPYETKLEVGTGLLAPVKILIVEDNKPNQLVAKAILEHKGYAVDIAEDGVEGVEAVANGDYHVVLMDIQMPRMDGVEATQKIRSLDSEKCEIPIIAVTANAMVGDRDSYLAAGMDDYVSKPIDSASLVETVQRWSKGLCDGIAPQDIHTT